MKPTSRHCLLCSLLISGCFSEPGEAGSAPGSEASGTTNGSSSGTAGGGMTTGSAETTGAATSSGVAADSTSGTISTTLGTTEDSSSTGDPVDPSLVLWLRFEEDPVSIGGAVDSSDQGLDPVCATTCPAQTEGPPGQGLAALFANAELLVIPDPPELELTEALSVAAWVRLDTAPSSEFGLVFGRDGGASVFNIYDLYYQQSVGGYVFSVAGQVAPTVPAGIGDWVHVVGTWSAESGLVRVYLDGVTLGSADAPTAPEYPDADVLIGSDAGSGLPLPFAGAIDDVRIYDRELSPEEVAELAQ